MYIRIHWILIIKFDVCMLYWFIRIKKQQVFENSVLKSSIKFQTFFTIFRL